MSKNTKEYSTILPVRDRGIQSLRRALIIDDEAGMRHSLRRLLQPTGYEVHAVKSGHEALSSVAEIAFDVALMNIQIAGPAGLEIFRRIRETDPKLPVVLITVYGTAELAIKAMQMGAYDYVLKPFDVANLTEIIARAAEVSRLSRVRVVIDPPPVIDPNEIRIVGINTHMQEVYKRIGQVAATDVPILVRGETGTGKELVARAVYQHSKRAQLPFLAINCAAIPEGLLESELFGHERGAFTNAFTRRIGKFEQANNGTIFLDEIGDMAINTQAKILRVLQDGTFQRLGGDTDLKVNVRVIAATHRNLETYVQEGLFREDLYYRLNVVSLNVPPLRDRKDDLLRLIDYFMGQFCAEMQIERIAISIEAMARLVRYDWPGNIRELQNCLKNAILTCRGIITKNDIHLSDMVLPISNEPLVLDLDDAWLSTLGENLHTIVMAEMEQRILLYALRRCDDNQVHAAELLGISRSMLRDRLRRYERTAQIKEPV
jgi:two-component system nitrogen regulation response regulator GlnG